MAVADFNKDGYKDIVVSSFRHNTISVLLGNGDDSFAPDVATVWVERVAVGPSPFVRGDANDDGHVNVADAVWIINKLFFSGSDSPCAEAVDVNGDKSTSLADVQYLLSRQFMNRLPPPPPFPDCDALSQAEWGASVFLQ